MPTQPGLILGESLRKLGERNRLTIPSELADELAPADGQCTLAKERPGCLSLWNTEAWSEQLTQGVELVQSKMQARRLEGRTAEVQRLGRLLSTRHRQIQLAGKGRIVIPEGFREFLGVAEGHDVVVVGAAVCVELWNPTHWHEYLNEAMPEFRRLLDGLAN